MEEDVKIETLIECNGNFLNVAVKSKVNENNDVSATPSSSLNQHEGYSENNENSYVSSQNNDYRNDDKLNVEQRITTEKHHMKNENINEIVCDDEVQELLDHQIINLTYAKPEDSNDEIDYEESDCIIEDILGENKSKRQHSQKLQSNIEKQVIDQLNTAKQLVFKKLCFFVDLGEALQTELTKNESKQRVLRNEIDRINIKFRKYSGELNETRCFFKKFGIPYFKDSNGFVPPINEDHKKKIKRKELHITSLPSIFFWTKYDKLRLIDAITDNIIVDRKEKLIKEIKKLKERICYLPHSEIKEVNSRIIKRQEEIESLKNKSFSDLLSGEDPDREFDWMKISFKFFTDIHSPEECQRYYHLFLKPTVNREYWKPNEDEALIKLAEKYNYQDWDTISKELGTNRSAYHCFVRYQTQLQGDGRYFQGRWTKEEDDKLMTVVNTSLIGGFIPWSKISAHVANRTHSQIYCRWQQSLNPKLVKGKYTEEEDLFIISGMQIFGSTYKELSSIMKNRTSSQIRDRYERNLMKQSSKAGSWSLEEDKQLLNLVEIHGKSNWCLISKQIGNRTRTQVRQRYNMIQKMMETHEGWNINTAKRKIINISDKNDMKIQKRVEKIRKEFQAAEKVFKLSGIEKETFRLENLKKLRDELYQKKFKSQRKKKVLADHSDVNKQLIELYRNSLEIPLKHISYTDSSSVNNYFNEIILMTKCFVDNIQLPQTIEEVRNNPRLDKHLKSFLYDVIKNNIMPKESVFDDNECIKDSIEDSIEENNIDYVAPEFDNTILMNEWWHTSPIDVSKLNFSEFFKRTVFDYSYGMHNDIWTAKCRRSQMPISEPNVLDKLESNNQQMYVTPNSLTLIGLRSIILSRARLKQTALGKGLANSINENSGTEGLANSINENSGTNHNQSQVILNIDPYDLEKYLQNLIILFTWPKGLSSVSNLDTLHGRLKNKPRYSKSIINSYKNEHSFKTDSLDEQLNNKDTLLVSNDNAGEKNIVCYESLNYSDQVQPNKRNTCNDRKCMPINKKLTSVNNKSCVKKTDDSQTIGCDSLYLDKSVIKHTSNYRTGRRKTRRKVVLHEVECDAQEKESAFQKTNNEDNHSICNSSNINVNISSESLNYSNFNKSDCHKNNESITCSNSLNTVLAESGLGNSISTPKNSRQLRKRILKKDEIHLPIKNAKS